VLDRRDAGRGRRHGADRPIATGPTATGPTGTTAAGGTLDGAVSLDLSARQDPTGAAMYSCNGIEGSWTYEPGELSVTGLEFTLTASEADMDDGTLIIEGEVTMPGAGSAGFVDTVELRITGTAEASAMESTGVRVEASGLLEGLPFDFAEFFPGEGRDPDRRRRRPVLSTA
jgi:hypothetical protein